MSEKENCDEFHIPPNKKVCLNGEETYCTNILEGCGWHGEREELNKHLNKFPTVETLLDGCQFTKLKCPFSTAGCDQEFLRKDMTGHLHEAHADETDAFTQAPKVRSLQNKVQELTKEHQQFKDKQTQLQEKLRIQEDLIQSNKEQISVMTQRIAEIDNQLQLASCTSDRAILPVRFNIDNFEQHKIKNDSWFSPHFWTHPHGYRMCLRVLANGEGQLEGHYVSVLLHMMKGKFDDLLEWPFRGIITIQLLDQEGEEDHWTQEIHFTDRTPNEVANRVMEGEMSKTGWGRFQFIQHNLLTPEYLKNNRLCFRVLQIETNITPQ